MSVAHWNEIDAERKKEALDLPANLESVLETARGVEGNFRSAA
jgi:hypothetical protein